eukprot:g2884.t1
MGKGRDKRRKQKGSSAAGQGAAKTQRKTVQNEQKQERRIDRRLQEDEEDLDALLQKFKFEDKKRTEVIIEDNSDPPSVRVHATYTPIPHEVTQFSHFSNSARNPEWSWSSEENMKINPITK